ncbi:MAG: pilus assembly protein TadG-related protein [Planctomycetota bacterium]
MKNAAPKRSGAILTLVVMLLFVLLAIAGLLIDIGMARLTQANMQSISDSAAMEGGWRMAMDAEEIVTRDAVVNRADQLSDSWGARRIELEGGFDLDRDGVPESSQTINRQSLGEGVEPTLRRNEGNAISGDIVLGQYDPTSVPGRLPGKPPGYDRGPAFIPSTDQPNALLVRLRRTGEDDIEGGVSAERLTYLWSRGSLIDLGLKGDGIAVRSETIVQVKPAVAVGWADHDELPGLLPDVAVRRSSLDEALYEIDDLVMVDEGYWIGVPASDQSPDTLPAVDGFFYLPVVDSIVSAGGQLHVVGFTVIQKQGSQINRIGFDDTDFEHLNATANLSVAADAARAFGQPLSWTDPVTSDVMEANAGLDPEFVMTVPSLVRSSQIQGGSP